MALGCSGPFSDPSPFAAMVASLKGSTDYKTAADPTCPQKGESREASNKQQHGLLRRISQIFLFKKKHVTGKTGDVQKYRILDGGQTVRPLTYFEN